MTELNKYIDVYAFRFTKPDHIDLVRLVYAVLIDIHFPHDIIRLCATTLRNLLSRDHLLSPSELTLAWQPLHDLYIEHVYGKGDRLPKDETLTVALEGAITAARPYFSLDATREILDVVRPRMHPFDDSMIRALRTLGIFMPTKLNKFEHDTYGAKLWVDELWDWYVADAKGVWEPYLVHLFARLTTECCGYIKWESRFDIIFARIMRTLDLTIKKNALEPQQVTSSPQQLQLMACWIVYMLGGSQEAGAQVYLSRMLSALESYLHPSNTGIHTEKLLLFLSTLCNTFIFRVHQERYCKKGATQISPEMRLTDAQIETFVESVLPSIEWTIFTKCQNDQTPLMMRHLAFLAPGLVLPMILNLVYSALTVTNEPHRLLQSMNCLVAICIPLIRDNKLTGKRVPLKLSVQKIINDHNIARVDALENKMMLSAEFTNRERRALRQRYFLRHQNSPVSPAASCPHSPLRESGSNSLEEFNINPNAPSSGLQSLRSGATSSTSGTSIDTTDSWDTSLAKILKNLNTQTARSDSFLSTARSGSFTARSGCSAASVTGTESTTTTSSTGASPAESPAHALKRKEQSVSASSSSSSSTSSISVSMSSNSTTSVGPSTVNLSSEPDSDEDTIELPSISSLSNSNKYPRADSVTQMKIGEETRRLLNSPLRGHVITLLEILVPALDINDINKTTMAFEAIQRLFSMIAIVDCSAAVDVRTDLNFEETVLCEATKRLPDIVDEFITRIFDLIQALSTTTPISSSAVLNSLTDNELDAKFSVEEMLLKKHMTMAFNALLDNCSSSIQERVIERLFVFVVNNKFDNTLGVSIVTGLIFQTIYNSPQEAFPMFLDYVMLKLPMYLTDEVISQRQLDSTTLWYISLACSLFIVPGEYIVKYRTECINLYKMLLALECPSAYLMGCNSLTNAIGNLLNTFVENDRGKQAMLSMPSTEFLPIQHWAKKVSKKQVRLSWHRPSEEELNMGMEFIRLFVFSMLDKLAKPEELRKDEIQKALTIMNSVLVASSEVLPPLEGEFIITEDTFVPMRFISYAKVDQELTLDGQNIRTLILEGLRELAHYLITNTPDDTKSLTSICAIYSNLVFARTTTPAMYYQLLAEFGEMNEAFSDPVQGKRATVMETVQAIVTLSHRQRLVLSQTSRVSFNAAHVKIIADLLDFIGLSSYDSVQSSATIVLNSMLQNFPQATSFVTDRIVENLSNENLSEDSFKGILSLISCGTLFVGNDWKIVAKLLPALVQAKYPENPQIIELLKVVEFVSCQGWKDTAITVKVPESLTDFARQIMMSSRGTSYAGYNGKFLTEEQQSNSVEHAAEKNKEILAVYDDLIEKLAALSQEAMHWRQQQFCQLFLSNMVKYRFSETGIKVLLRQLLDDKVETRVIAMNSLAAWLRTNRPAAFKTALSTMKHFQLPNRTVGSQYPITFGLLLDNFFLAYDSARMPKDAKAWDAMPMVNKQFIGFYQWPKEVKLDAANSTQLEANRQKHQLHKEELIIVNAFADPEFLKRFVDLVLSQKHDGKYFDITVCRLIFYLFRNYNDILLEPLLKVFEQCLSSDDIAKRRFAPEIFVAIVRGSKLWTFQKLQPLWTRLEALLTPALEQLTPELFPNWGTACEAICYHVDPRRYGWFIELVLKLCVKPMTHVNQTEIRFTLLTTIISYTGWRGTTIHNSALIIAKPMMYTPYFTVRQHTAQLFNEALALDIPGFTKDFTIPPSYSPITMSIIIGAFAPELRLLWAEAVDVDEGFVNPIKEPVNKDDRPERKIALNALKSIVTMLNLYYDAPYRCICKSVAHMIPLLAHFEHDGDGEMAKITSNAFKKYLSKAFVMESMADFVVWMLEKTFKHARSWRTKAVLIPYMQQIVFANLFVFETPSRRDKMMRLIHTAIGDSQIEFRHAAAECLSAFIHYGYIEVTDDFINHFFKLAQFCRKENFHKKHAGILGLGAILLAFPYSVPKFLPRTQ
uniref:Proteasome activator complex subunit 4 n=1 Tax=Panagrellus redivivus TaxID=6233 RepID=A0A7E4WDS4_PANRE